MLTIQTNDGLNNANSYVSVAEFTQYIAARGITVNGNAEQLLIRAMDALEAKQYKSEPVKTSQSTKWPRMGVAIPRDIKTAQMLLAVAADTAIPITDTPTAAIKREKVDVVEVEYFEGSSSQSELMTMVENLLAPYLAGASIAANFRVYRG